MNLFRLGFVLSNQDDSIEINEFINCKISFENNPHYDNLVSISASKVISTSEKNDPVNVLSSVIIPFHSSKLIYHIEITKNESNFFSKDPLAFGKKF